MKFFFQLVYFRFWIFIHPRTIQKLTQNKRKLEIVKYLILDSPDNAVTYTRCVANFNELQMAHMERAIEVKLLRQSPLRRGIYPSKKDIAE